MTDLSKLAARVDRLNPPTGCAVPDCGRPHFALHLCHAHYQAFYRQRRSGAKLAPAVKPKPKPGAKSCTVPGCDRRTHALGLCKRHYHQHRRANGAQW